MEAWKCVVFSQGAVFQADWPLYSSQSKSVSQTISRGYLQRKVVPCGKDSPKVDRIWKGSRPAKWSRSYFYRVRSIFIWVHEL